MHHNFLNTLGQFVSVPLPECPDSFVVDIPLNRQILNDLEFGVSSRPSLPACFDDDDALSAGSVDDVTDLRYSPWDSAAHHCRFRPSDKPVTIGEEIGGVEPSSDPADLSSGQN